MVPGGVACLPFSALGFMVSPFLKPSPNTLDDLKVLIKGCVSGLASTLVKTPASPIRVPGFESRLQLPVRADPRRQQVGQVTESLPRM